MRKIFKVCISITLLLLVHIVVSTFITNNKKEKEINEETLVDLAIEKSEIKINDYIDVNYFTSLRNITSLKTENTQTLSSNLINEEIEIYEEIDDIQYETITSSILNIFNDLSDEEYEAFETLAEEDVVIAEMLDMIESDFTIGNDKITNKTSNIVKLSTALASIASLLTLQKVCSAGISVITGAFNTMITAIKAYFLPSQIKAAVITAGILCISTIVIINWNKIKPIFNKLVNVFIDNAKKMASTVKKVFSSIQTLAVSSTTYNSFEDVVNKNTTINERLNKSGKTLGDLKNVLLSFLQISSLTKFYNAKDKVLCIGRDIPATYLNDKDISGYQNYAKQYNFWSFWVQNYSDFITDYSQEFINLCNDVLIYYCCSADWDFVLVTNPYHYMVEHLDTKSYGGSAYATEISIIRSNNYNYFVNSTLSWSSIPNPGNSKTSYFSYAGYRISK